MIRQLVTETTKHVGGRNRDRIKAPPVPQEKKTKKHKKQITTSCPRQTFREDATLLHYYAYRQSERTSYPASFSQPNLFSFLKLVLLTVIAGSQQYIFL